MNTKTQLVTSTGAGELVPNIGVEGGTLSVAQIKANRSHVKEILRELMEKDVHYGTIQGTDKPSILKPGTELLMSIFRIDGQPQIEDLSDDDCIRYRVILKGVHAPTGLVIGHGVGECSTNEEKYKWRATYNQREWENADLNRTRTKYGYDKRERREYEVRQIRTNPADAANTVLKMAKKRAGADMMLTILAVSDIFGQDAEDMAEWLKENDGDAPPPANSKAASTKPPQAKAEGSQPLNAQQLAHLRREIDKVGCGEKPVLMKFNVDTLELLPFAQLNPALTYIKTLSQEPPQ